MKTLLIAMILAATTVQAADPNWLVISSSTGKEFAFKKGSCEIGEGAIVCLERQADNIKHVSAFTMTGTAVDACKAGFGQLVTFDLQGKELYRNDVIAQGGTNAANEFDALCLILARSKT